MLYALDKVRKEADEYFSDQIGDSEKNIPEGKDHWSHWHNFAEKQLFGIEINEQIARTAKMNMIIHDDGHTNVIATDGLLNDETLRQNNDGFEYGTFDFIITNPPFGSSVKQNEKAYLHQYNLGNKDVSWLDTKNTNVSRETLWSGRLSKVHVKHWYFWYFCDCRYFRAFQATKAVETLLQTIVLCEIYKRVCKRFVREFCERFVREFCKRFVREFLRCL